MFTFRNKPLWLRIRIVGDLVSAKILDFLKNQHLYVCVTWSDSMPFFFSSSSNVNFTSFIICLLLIFCSAGIYSLHIHLFVHQRSQTVNEMYKWFGGKQFGFWIESVQFIAYASVLQINQICTDWPNTSSFSSYSRAECVGKHSTIDGKCQFKIKCRNNDIYYWILFPLHTKNASHSLFVFSILCELNNKHKIYCLFCSEMKICWNVITLTKREIQTSRM